MKKLPLSALIFSFVILIVACQKKEDTSAQTSIRNGVIDSTSLLSNDQKNDLEGLIQKLENETGSQVAIVIIDTLGGKNIKEVSLTVAENLNLGREKYRDGLLIFVVYKDRKVRIEIGYGLERVIGNETASRIIKEKMAPKFKEENYYEGLLSAVKEISELIKTNKQFIGEP